MALAESSHPHNERPRRQLLLGGEQLKVTRVCEWVWEGGGGTRSRSSLGVCVWGDIRLTRSTHLISRHVGGPPNPRVEGAGVGSGGGVGWGVGVGGWGGVSCGEGRGGLCVTLLTSSTHLISRQTPQPLRAYLLKMLLLRDTPARLSPGCSAAVKAP